VGNKSDKGPVAHELGGESPEPQLVGRAIQAPTDQDLSLAPPHGRKLQLLIGPLVTVGLILWISSRIDFDAVFQNIRTISIAWIPIMIGTYLVGFVFRGIRWRLMLKNITDISWYTSTSIIIIGYMANNLLPARMGEFVRALVLNDNSSVSKTAALTSIVLERTLDGLVLLGILYTVTVFGIQPVNSKLLHHIISLAGLLFVGVFVLLVSVRVFQENSLRLLKKIVGAVSEKTAQRLLKMHTSIVEALDTVKFDYRFLVIVLLSIIIWFSEGIMFWVGLVAFGIPAQFQIAFVTLAIINFGLLVPSAPGYVGLFQTAGIVAFGLFGLSEQTALSYSIVLHICQFVPITVLGLFLLSTLDLKLKSKILKLGRSLY
jgi:glycosyltransferase 2 family protein